MPTAAEVRMCFDELLEQNGDCLFHFERLEKEAGDLAAAADDAYMAGVVSLVRTALKTQDRDTLSLIANAVALSTGKKSDFLQFMQDAKAFSDEAAAEHAELLATYGTPDQIDEKIAAVNANLLEVIQKKATTPRAMADKLTMVDAKEAEKLSLLRAQRQMKELAEDIRDEKSILRDVVMHVIDGLKSEGAFSVFAYDFAAVADHRRKAEAYLAIENDVQSKIKMVGAAAQVLEGPMKALNWAYKDEACRAQEVDVDLADIYGKYEAFTDQCYSEIKAIRARILDPLAVPQMKEDGLSADFNSEVAPVAKMAVPDVSIQADIDVPVQPTKTRSGPPEPWEI